jgi:hypothetical protein
MQLEIPWSDDGKKGAGRPIRQPRTGRCDHLLSSARGLRRARGPRRHRHHPRRHPAGYHGRRVDRRCQKNMCASSSNSRACAPTRIYSRPGCRIPLSHCQRATPLLSPAWWIGTSKSIWRGTISAQPSEAIIEGVVDSTTPSSFRQFGHSGTVRRQRSAKRALSVIENSTGAPGRPNAASSPPEVGADDHHAMGFGRRFCRAITASVSKRLHGRLCIHRAPFQGELADRPIAKLCRCERHASCGAAFSATGLKSAPGQTRNSSR